MSNTNLTAKEAIEQITAICKSLDPSVVWGVTDFESSKQARDSEGKKVQVVDSEFTLTIRYGQKAKR